MHAVVLGHSKFTPGIPRSWHCVTTLSQAGGSVPDDQHWRYSCRQHPSSYLKLLAGFLPDVSQVDAAPILPDDELSPCLTSWSMWANIHQRLQPAMTCNSPVRAQTTGQISGVNHHCSNHLLMVPQTGLSLHQNQPLHCWLAVVSTSYSFNHALKDLLPYLSLLKVVTVSGKVRFCAMVQGTPSSSMPMLGSPVITVRAEKSTRLPMRLPRMRPPLPLRRCRQRRKAEATKRCTHRAAQSAHSRLHHTRAPAEAAVLLQPSQHQHAHTMMG